MRNKPAPALFQSDCTGSGCHKGPQGLSKGQSQGSLTGFLRGLRLGVTYSWLALLVVEQVNATSGLGYMINLARTYGQTEVIILCLAVYAALGLSSDWLVRFITRKALPWRKILAD